MELEISEIIKLYLKNIQVFIQCLNEFVQHNFFFFIRRTWDI